MAVLITQKDWDTVYSIAYSKTKNVLDSEEITQQVFLRVIDCNDTIKDKTAFFAFITHNLIKNYYRNKSALKVKNVLLYEEDSSSIMNTKASEGLRNPEVIEFFEKLMLALKALPHTNNVPTYKVLELKLKDMENKEIAEKLNLSVEAVKWHLRRIRGIGQNLL